MLKRAFDVDTIAELAENKYVKIAQIITIPVSINGVAGKLPFETRLN